MSHLVPAAKTTPASPPGDTCPAPLAVTLPCDPAA